MAAGDENPHQGQETETVVLSAEMTLGRHDAQEQRKHLLRGLQTDNEHWLKWIVVGEGGD
jgi:hypothetical protein